MLQPETHRDVVRERHSDLLRQARAGEDLLEHVLGVLAPQPVCLAADRVHVAGEAGDELAPGVLVAAAAPGDELPVREGGKLHSTSMKPDPARCGYPAGRRRGASGQAVPEKGGAPVGGRGSCPLTRYQPRDKVRIGGRSLYSVQIW